MASENILSSARELVDSIDASYIPRLNNARQSIRAATINTILEKLPSDELNTINIAQSLPLVFTERRDELSALSFIETLAKDGHVVGWDIFEEVYNRITTAISSPQRYTAEVRSFVISRVAVVLNLVKKHESYKVNPRLDLIIGDFESHINSRPNQAKKFYKKAINKGESAAKLALCDLYISHGEYQSALKILEEGSDTQESIELSYRKIQILIHLGDQESAFKYHRQLLTLHGKNVIKPFFFFRQTVENDNDLRDLEIFLYEYTKDYNDMYPSQNIKNLTNNAEEYIVNQVRAISTRMENLDIKPAEISPDECEEYHILLEDRLWLMQVSIFSLHSPRFIQPYLTDIDTLVSDSHARTGLFEYFSERSVPALQDTNNEPGGPRPYVKDSESRKDIGYYLTTHLGQMLEIFSQGGLLDLCEEVISPNYLKYWKQFAFRDSMDIEPEVYENIENLRSEVITYESLSSRVRAIYMNMRERFDQKYGITYRYFIQRFARILSNPDEYPHFLKDNKDVAALFFIEKLLVNDITLSVFDETTGAPAIKNIINDYNLTDLNLEDATAFGSVLAYDHQETAAFYLAGYPGVLDDQSTLYAILDAAGYLTTGEQTKLVKLLHYIARDEGKGRGFFEHMKKVRATLDPITSSTEDFKYPSLNLGKISLFQGDIPEASNDLFLAAARQFGGYEGFIDAADNLRENIGDYKGAIKLYQEAYSVTSSPIALSGIIGCYLALGDTLNAQKYLLLTLSQGQNQPGYSMQYTGMSMDYRSAITIALEKLRDGNSLAIDSPDIEDLFKRMSHSIDTKLEISIDEIADKIKASYFDLLTQDAKLPQIFVAIGKHWDYIKKLALHPDTESRDQVLIDTFSSMDYEDPDISERNTEIRIIAFLHTHAKNCSDLIQPLLGKESNSKQIEATVSRYNELLWKIIEVLELFPGSRAFVMGWKGEIVMLLSDKSIIQTELPLSTTIH